MLPSANALFVEASASQRYLAVTGQKGSSFAYLSTLKPDTDEKSVESRNLWNDSDVCGLTLLDIRDAFAFDSGSNPIAEPERCSSHAERGSP